MGKAARAKAQRRQAAARQASGSAPTPEATYPAEHQARHEAGHAVVHWALAIPFEHVSLDTNPPAVWPLASATKQLGDKWLIGAAGCIADYQARKLTMLDADIPRLLIGSPDDRFALIDESGAVAVRPDRRPAVQRGGDLYLMTLVMTNVGQGPVWPVPTIIEVWRGCENYVSPCAPAISAVAADLLVRRQLTYADTCDLADDAMRDRPRPGLPDWFEKAQELGRSLAA